MTFELTIHGDSPADLLTALQQLGGTANIANSPAQQPQSAPVPQPDKPKAQTPTKAKKAAQKPAAQSPTVTTQAAASGTTTDPDPTMENKIRSLIMALMKQGRTPDCKAIITACGAKSISTIQPEHYAEVWEKLCALNEEVNQNAAG